MRQSKELVNRFFQAEPLCRQRGRFCPGWLAPESLRKLFRVESFEGVEAFLAERLKLRWLEHASAEYLKRFGVVMEWSERNEWSERPGPAMLFCGFGPWKSSPAGSAQMASRVQTLGLYDGEPVVPATPGFRPRSRSLTNGR